MYKRINDVTIKCKENVITPHTETRDEIRNLKGENVWKKIKREREYLNAQTTRAWEGRRSEMSEWVSRNESCRYCLI